MSKDVFLPLDYDIPTSGGNYMKFQQGANRFRILASPIVGWEWWVPGDNGKNKPVRCRMSETVPMEAAEGVRHFWAMPVWNYATNHVEILEITQKGLQKAIRQLSEDAEWGNPLDYDIEVNRQGEGLETEYSLVPKPAKALSTEALAAWDAIDINLEALYDGEDPFFVTKKATEKPNPLDPPPFSDEELANI